MAVLCLFFKTTAQDIKVRGRVTTLPDHQPLPGATIRIKETSGSTQTDSKGGFTINATRSEGTLTASYTGYKTREIKYDVTSGELNIELEENKSDLDEVVVIGYGQTTRKLNTGSVASISAKEIERQPVTNVLSALSGRMPGVFVQTTNGLPGGNINIQIRGKGSIAAGTNPLYIVDGVPYDGNAPVAANLPLSNNVSGAISPLNNLNPGDIESITVLKDADATSIYGSRGSNGVVLITTKRAISGATTFNSSLKQGFTSLAIKPRLLGLKDYLDIRREAYANENLTPSSDPLSPNYAPDLTIWSQTEGTDWADYIFGNTANTTDLQARLSGGQGNTTFSVNGNYHHENTVLPGFNSYKRGGLTSQFKHRSQNNKLNLSVSNQLTYQLNQLSNVINGVSRSYLSPPNRPVYLPDGSYNWYPGSNIEAEKNAKSITKTENTITNLEIGYALLPVLNVKVSAGHTKTSYDQSQIFPTNALAPGTINYSQLGDNFSNSYIVEPQLDYALTIGKSKLSFLAGGTLQSRINDRIYIQASNFKLESLMEDLGSAGTIDSRTTSYSNYKFASLFGRVTYNLDDTYIINATLRRDGSSKFGPGNRFGNFGSAGAAWIFSNWSVVKKSLPFLSHGKLRASFGSTGNDQIPDYGYSSTYGSPGANIYQDVASIRPSRISNANFRWETTRKTDIAVELGFLKDRIYLTANYYNNQSVDQLVQYAIPQITGFTGYQVNLPAVVVNKGWEFATNIRFIESKGLSWTGIANLTIPKNRLKSFENLETSSYRNTYQIGADISRFFGYKFMGMNPATGKAQYAGQDGNISSSPYSFFPIGVQTPDYYGGIGTSLAYKGFELNVFAQFAKQESAGSIPTAPGLLSNNFEYIKNRWSGSNPSSTVPRASALNTDFYLTSSSLNIFDTSYLRLKTISLTYSLPGKILSRAKINNMKVFADAQNIFTWWNSDAAILDPESGAASSALSRNFPALKTIVFGLQFTL